MSAGPDDVFERLRECVRICNGPITTDGEHREGCPYASTLDVAVDLRHLRAKGDEER